MIAKIFRRKKPKPESITVQIDLDSRWVLVEKKKDGASYRSNSHQLFVIVSGARELDGHMWVHVSFSKSHGGIPGYYDMTLVKELFIGKDQKAIHVFPPESEHLDIAGALGGREVLHLWSCLDADVLPDFTWGGTGL